MSDQARRERAAEHQRASAGRPGPEIPRALTPSEWQARETHRVAGADVSYALVRTKFGRALALRVASGAELQVGNVADLAAIIALANDGLNDEDRRKIRYAHVAALRAEVQAVFQSTENISDAMYERYQLLGELADALESYLP